MSARATLIYDGECSLCVAAAAWLDRRRPSGDGDVISVVDAQQWFATARGGTVVSREEIARAAWWIEDGRRIEGSRAVAQALIAVGGGWRLVGRALSWPPVEWIAAPTYRFVARHRRVVPRRHPS